MFGMIAVAIDVVLLLVMFGISSQLGKIDARLYRLEKALVRDAPADAPQSEPGDGAQH